MKKTIIAVAALLLCMNLRAQTLNDGIKMYQYERYQSAEKILAPLATGNAMANYYYGLALLAEGRVADAKAVFAKFPEDIANMSGTARVAFSENNNALAMQICQTIIGKAKKKDWEPFRYAADALTYSDGADYQQAISWYKTALERADDADVHIGMGDAYQKINGGGGEAMNNYDHVTDKDSKNSLVYSRKGALWYAAHAYNDALVNYRKAIETDPNNPIPYKALADVYFWVAKYDSSLNNIKRYMQLSDNSCDDKIKYATILYLAKQYNDAITTSNQIIANCHPVKPTIYGILGFSQKEVKDTVNAMRNLRVYFNTMDPKKITPNDYLDFAKVFMPAMPDSANAYFNKAIQKDTSKDKSDIYRQIAEGYKQAKDYPNSANWYNRIITENPNTGAIDYFWTVVMYYYAHDYKNGATAAEKFETKYPSEQSSTYWRGRIGAAVDTDAVDSNVLGYFKRWTEKVGPNYEKKNDLKTAYEYMLLYYFKKEDKDNTEKYKQLLLAIDPNDGLVKQIEKYQKDLEEQKKAAAKKPAPKPKTR